MNDTPNMDTSQITPAQFAELVGSSTDEQLAEGLAANRDLVLQSIFTQMSEHFDPVAAGGIEATIQWRITGGEGGEPDHWHVIIKEQVCEVNAGGIDSATITMEMDGVDFIKLAAAKVAGPELFMTGRLRIEGDMMLAARIQGLFKPPQTG